MTLRQALPHRLPADLRRRSQRALLFGARMIASFIWWELVVARLLGQGRARPGRIARMTSLARRFRSLALELGGVWIKLGQFLSSRVDILPPEVTESLAALQDAVPAESPEHVVSVIEEELGKPLAACFDAFEMTPIAAASFGQAHRALIRESGERVVVKVQRPHLDEIVAVDLRALKTIAGWLKRYPPIRQRADLNALAREFSEGVLAELDYEREAHSAETFAANFANDPGVLVPRVFKRLSTRRVLTLENVEYIKITDFDGLTAAGISRQDVARKLFETYLQQFLIDGFFHADPHPGNLFAQPVLDGSATRAARLPATSRSATPVWDSAAALAAGFMAGWTAPPASHRKDSTAASAGRPFRLVFIDFGMMGRVDATLMRELRELILGVALKDPGRITGASQRMGFFLPGADMTRIEQAIGLTFERYWGKTMDDLTSAGFSEIFAFAMQFRDLLFTLPFQIPQNVLYLGRAASVLSGMSMNLDPEFNVWTSLQPFATGTVSASGITSPGALLADVVRVLGQLTRVPGQSTAFFDRALTGQLEVRAAPPNPSTSSR
ncbi:MAG: AarF/UbiB family protein, partial [Thermoflexales bacterium]